MKKKVTTICLTQYLKDQHKVFQDKTGVGLSELIRKLLTEFYKKNVLDNKNSNTNV